MHSEPNEYDVLRILDLQKEGIVAGYDALRSRVGPGALQRTILVGLLIALGSLKEAFKTLSRMQPSIGKAIAPFESELNAWERLRHDAAHLFDRIFMPVRKNANDPWLSGGFAITVYDANTDLVWTGQSSEGSIRLLQAIYRAFEAINVAEAKLHEIKYGDTDPGHEPVADQILAIRQALRGAKLT